MAMKEHVHAPLDRVSRTGGTVKLTISSNAATGPDTDFVSALVVANAANTGNITMNIGAAADADDFPITSSGISVPITGNLSNLHFYGDTDTDVVNILWRR